MRFEISDVKSFKTIIEGLSTIVDESVFEFGTDKVNVNALDKSHTTFMMVEMDKHYFDEYYCEPEQIIIDVNQLQKIMKRCKNDDILICETEDNNLIMTFKGDSDRTFRMRLIDNEYESPRPPMIEYPVNITIPSMVLNDTLGDLKILSDVIKVSVDEDYIRFDSEGQSGEAQIKYIHGENIREYVEASYSIEKLSEIMKVKDFSESLLVKLGDDLPITIVTELPTNDARLTFLLAPRINQDD